MARTDTLGHFLTDVADAIREKTGSSEAITASSFDTEIESIPTGSTTNVFNNYTGGSASYWWQSSYAASSEMENIEIDVTAGIKTGKNLQRFFATCKWRYIPKLITTEHINDVNFSSVYSLCSNIQSLDLSKLDISVQYFGSAFEQCTNLRLLDIRKMTLSTAANWNNAFLYVPTNCKIIVKDATEKAWFNTNFSTLTNVKTVEEYEAE